MSATRKARPAYWHHLPTQPPQVPVGDALQQPHTLAIGSCLSYGDVCWGTESVTRLPNGIIQFDETSGKLTCHAGTTLTEIIEYALPRGWFPMVVPGTQFITVGGAIANDIHGKNHHLHGTFCRWVLQCKLLRSDRSEPVLCSPEAEPELFRATCGGLGLTGVITEAELQLKKVPGSLVLQKSIPFDSLESFQRIDQEHEKTTYTASWFDATRGSGVYLTGEFIDSPYDTKSSWPLITFKRPWPVSPLTNGMLDLMCRVYSATRKTREDKLHYEKVFFPLDIAREWLYAYGLRGMQQFQCAGSFELMQRICDEVKKSPHRSFLSVLKRFGEQPTCGLISFNKPGYTVALDFPHHPQLTPFLQHLDRIVLEHEGLVYIAKDGHMRPETFQQMYPKHTELMQLKDPKCESVCFQRLFPKNP